MVAGSIVVAGVAIFWVFDDCDNRAGIGAASNTQGQPSNVPSTTRTVKPTRANPSPLVKAPPEVLAVLPADGEFSSTDDALRAVRPSVTEILIGY
jgi:hypothetical protein